MSTRHLADAIPCPSNNTYREEEGKDGLEIDPQHIDRYPTLCHLLPPKEKKTIHLTHELTAACQASSRTGDMAGEEAELTCTIVSLAVFSTPLAPLASHFPQKRLLSHSFLISPHV